MNTEMKVKWYDKAWFMWVLFIFVPYIAIPFMWLRKKSYSSKKKIVLSIVFGVYALLIISSMGSESGNIDEPTVPTLQEAQTSNSSSSTASEQNSSSTAALVDTPNYKVVNTDIYVRDGKECTAYRVVISDDATEDEMRAVFTDIVVNDTSYLRTVWFYGLESDIENIGFFTVGMLEELDEIEKESETPTFTKASYSAEDIESLRNSVAPSENESGGAVSEVEPNARPNNLTTGQRNATESAKSYLVFAPFSFDGLVQQLEFEGYSNEDAIFAVENCGADWNEQALKSAINYLEFAPFSYSGLIEQLKFEGFSDTEAKFAADNCNADWNEQAALAAENYLAFTSFSRTGLIEQLQFEGYTSEQAIYGVEQNGY